ncbi:rhamnan synthesis F family protein [Roseinatronobacter sp. NSM]|uniref:rhamnan synthesis F family protein n=1 Tax=Roseinatronobacter sp. NSM TaxID=3457785 RepID=UPI00403664DA
MIPKWKIAREARRVREQVKALLMTPVYWHQQRSFDRQRNARIEVSEGGLVLGANVVVLLVYQPKGVSQSTFHTLEHLQAEGFSAFVVLNSGVSAAEYDRLKAHCALIMKRPNFGYDFGGYRDAILHLTTQPHALDSITCINDSIWFPVFKQCDHLSRMRGIAGNLIGYSFAKGFKTRKNAHVQSYLFMFKDKVFLNSDDFRDYWANLKVSNSRHFTIRNSEMGMTAYFQGKNHKIGWLFSADDMRHYYTTCADQDILAARSYLDTIGHHSAALFRDLPLHDVPAIRHRLIEGLENGKLSRNVIGSEPGMLFHGIGFAAMKKSASYNYQMQRQISIDRGICQQFAPQVEQEILTMASRS